MFDYLIGALMIGGYVLVAILIARLAQRFLAASRSFVEAFALAGVYAGLFGVGVAGGGGDPGFAFPVLLLWADEDAFHPLAIAEEALDLLPDAQLRVLKRTGFLVAYDDPVGLAREILAFCG